MNGIEALDAFFKKNEERMDNITEILEGMHKAFVLLTKRIVALEEKK